MFQMTHRPLQQSENNCGVCLVDFEGSKGQNWLFIPFASLFNEWGGGGGERINKLIIREAAIISEM